MKVFRLACYLMSSLAIVGAVVVYTAYRASQSVPEFYETALQLEPTAADEAGNELEHRVLELQNDLETGEAWQLALSETQINGWLAHDLPQKFPHLLPAQVRAPRVAVMDDVVKVACRIESEKLSSVLSFQLGAYLTDSPNVIALRVSKVRAGRLPVPLGDMLEKISASARRSGIEVKWGQDGGDPVALVTLPTESPDLKDGVVVEALEIADQQVTVAGTAGNTQSRVADSLETHNRQR